MKKIIFSLVCLGLLAAGQPALAKDKVETFTLTGYLYTSGRTRYVPFSQKTDKNLNFSIDNTGRSADQIFSALSECRVNDYVYMGEATGGECQVTVNAVKIDKNEYEIIKILKVKQTRIIKNEKDLDY